MATAEVQQWKESRVPGRWLSRGTVGARAPARGAQQVADPTATPLSQFRGFLGPLVSPSHPFPTLPGSQLQSDLNQPMVSGFVWLK